MKLSEAIRLGAMASPQGFGGLSADATYKATCAIGAAREALGIKGDVENYDDVTRMYPFLTEKQFCPACGFWTQRISILWHLNDEHRWTREAIADWVESIEPATEGDNERTESTPSEDAVATPVGVGNA